MIGIFFVLTLCISVIIYRTGTVPAASGGDEVWWSESGYFLLNEGRLRWPMLASNAGFAERSYWPPVLPIVQAAFLRVFGVNAIGIYAQSTLHCLVLVGSVIALVRLLGASQYMSMLSSLAVFAPFSIERQVTQVRMESMTAISGLVFLVFIFWSIKETTSTKRQVYSGFLAGFAASIGVASYYPLSPFFFISVIVSLIASKVTYRFILSFYVGLSPILIALVTWILQDWNAFYEQIIVTSRDYTSIHQFASSLLTFDISLKSLAQWEQNSSFVLALLLLSYTNDKKLRTIALFSICNFASEFVYPNVPQLIPSCVAVVLIFSLDLPIACKCCWNRLQPKAVVKILGYSAALIGIVKISLIGVTCVTQHDGRDYSFVRTKLDQFDFSSGGVAISQRAWLAMRPRISDDRLHFLVYSGPSLRQASEIIKGNDIAAINFFDWLILETWQIDELRTLYPWIDKGIKDGTYLPIERIRPNWKPLPWAKGECYDLTVFAKKKGD